MLYHHERFRRLLLLLLKYAPIIQRHHFYEFFPVSGPIFQYCLCARALGQFEVPGNQAPNEGFFLRVFQLFEIDHLQVASLSKITGVIGDVCNTAAHARCKISAGVTQNDNPSACHVFATVVADTFNNGNGTAVTNAEPLTGNTSDERFAGRRAV